MADDVFRQERKKIDPSEINEEAKEKTVQEKSNPLEAVHNYQRQAGVSVGGPEMGEQQISGTMPPAMKELFQQRVSETGSEQPMSQPPPQQANPFQQAAQLSSVPGMKPMPGQLVTNDPALAELLNGLSTQNYEEVTLPSLGKFYNTDDTPRGGVLHLRPMTGQEESILSTGRLMRKGNGMEMIFKNCIQEKNIDIEKLLSIDRTYLLIYLRAISYGHMYDVSVRCPQCDTSSDHQVNLNLPLKYCPENFNEESLNGKLPASGYFFRYRLPNGRDESMITDYRERKTSQSANVLDDTFLFKASLLIEEISNNDVKLATQHGIKSLLERLSARDVNYIRNRINVSPFGADTDIDLVCPYCLHQFKRDLPYDANFFFPEETIEI